MMIEGKEHETVNVVDCNYVTLNVTDTEHCNINVSDCKKVTLNFANGENVSLNVSDLKGFSVNIQNCCCYEVREQDSNKDGGK